MNCSRAILIIDSYREEATGYRGYLIERYAPDKPAILDIERDLRLSEAAQIVPALTRDLLSQTDHL